MRLQYVAICKNLSILFDLFQSHTNLLPLLLTCKTKKRYLKSIHKVSKLVINNKLKLISCFHNFVFFHLCHRFFIDITH